VTNQARSTQRSEPLRIGILGAARIAELSMIGPARATGQRVVAVAARNPDRAKAFAEQHGVDRAHADYQGVLDDPDVEVVYNALVNSQHARWNIAALQAGKHVLSEKPFTANADQATAVKQVAAASGRRIVEGFHYLHHPVAQRLRQIVASGRLGELRHVEIGMQMAAPPDDDPRWSYELAGGALMDIGCYALHACRQFGRWTSGEPQLVSATGGARAGRPAVDEWMTVGLAYPDSLSGTARWNMASTIERRMTWAITGEHGSVMAPSWPVPHLDDRVVLTRRPDRTRSSWAGGRPIRTNWRRSPARCAPGSPSASMSTTPWHP
jgi:predicted dehydrogenase